MSIKALLPLINSRTKIGDTIEARWLEAKAAAIRNTLSGYVDFDVLAGHMHAASIAHSIWSNSFKDLTIPLKDSINNALKDIDAKRRHSELWVNTGAYHSAYTEELNALFTEVIDYLPSGKSKRTSMVS